MIASVITSDTWEEVRRIGMKKELDCIQTQCFCLESGVERLKRSDCEGEWNF